MVPSQPEMIILMLCGYTAQRRSKISHPGDKTGLGQTCQRCDTNQIFAIDAGAYTSRSGPRLVQGLEIIAEILHPELFFGLLPDGGCGAG